MKIEIGGRGKPRKGWKGLDHNYGDHWDLMFDSFQEPDNSVDMFYLCMVIEHIPLKMAPMVYKKLYAKLKKKGKIRLVTPDLKQLAKAYVNGDQNFLNKTKIHVDQLHKKLGISGHFLNCLISYGHDTVLMSRDRRHVITGMAHVCMYDFDILRILLKKAGFRKIKRMKLDKKFEPRPYAGALIVEAYK